MHARHETVPVQPYAVPKVCEGVRSQVGQGHARRRRVLSSREAHKAAARTELAHGATVESFGVLSNPVCKYDRRAPDLSARVVIPGLRREDRLFSRGHGTKFAHAHRRSTGRAGRAAEDEGVVDLSRDTRGQVDLAGKLALRGCCVLLERRGGAVLQEPVEHRCRPTTKCLGERRLAEFVLREDQGRVATLEEELYNLFVLVLHGPVQRRVAALVGQENCSCIEEDLSSHAVAVGASHVQRRRAALVRVVDLRAGLQHGAQVVVLAVPRAEQ
mmetsp:Transcript_23313/g.59921  ORF Transcript_23313/g.59921 Transcript_23313/m.59921 type:complete len:272 (+) Transcript_23313:594-1409(+)